MTGDELVIRTSAQELRIPVHRPAELLATLGQVLGECVKRLAIPAEEVPDLVLRVLRTLDNHARTKRTGITDWEEETPVESPSARTRVGRR
jgi:hypothetical protein